MTVRAICLTHKTPISILGIKYMADKNTNCKFMRHDRCHTDNCHCECHLDLLDNDSEDLEDNLCIQTS